MRFAGLLLSLSLLPPALTIAGEKINHNCRILRSESWSDGGSFMLEFTTKPHSVTRLVFRTSLFEDVPSRLLISNQGGKLRELPRGDPSIEGVRAMIRLAAAGTPKPPKGWAAEEAQRFFRFLRASGTQKLPSGWTESIRRLYNDPATAYARELEHKHLVAKRALRVLANWKKQPKKQ